MGLTSVEATASSFEKRAKKLAEEWKVPLEGPAPSRTEGIRAVVSEVGIGLAFNDSSRGKKPFYVDFTSAEWKRRLSAGLPKNHIFRRALGLKEKPGRIFDATAGFGQDTLMMLSIGAPVTAIERSPVVFAVLEDAVQRAKKEEESLRDKFSRLKLVRAESLEFLSKVSADQAPDVIYLDPMFDKPKKTAKSPKDMQLLQELLGHPPGAEEELALLEQAIKTAIDRVVVKRPLKAKALKPGVTHSYKGQSVRYDVYLRRSSDFSVS